MIVGGWWQPHGKEGMIDMGGAFQCRLDAVCLKKEMHIGEGHHLGGIVGCGGCACRSWTLGRYYINTCQVCLGPLEGGCGMTDKFEVEANGRTLRVEGHQLPGKFNDGVAASRVHDVL